MAQLNDVINVRYKWKKRVLGHLFFTEMETELKQKWQMPQTLKKVDITFAVEEITYT